MTDLVRVSKLLSLILRHKPEKFGVVLDPEGYAPLADILAAVRTSLPHATEGAVVNTVEQDKQRFTILDGEIRANYGHSIRERIAHPQATPPAVLLHGTAEHTVESILEAGLRPMKRQYVHLTTNPALAARIGARHGRVRVLTVDARRAHAEGIAFYRANDAFWLADAVPARFLAA
jgi:putative RNA 2'-phosphotransferase